MILYKPSKSNTGESSVVVRLCSKILLLFYLFGLLADVMSHVGSNSALPHNMVNLGSMDRGKRNKKLDLKLSHQIESIVFF